MPRFNVTCGFVSPPRAPHYDVQPTLGEYDGKNADQAIERANVACAREGIELNGTMQAHKVVARRG